MGAFKCKICGLCILALVALPGSGFKKQDGFSPVENKQQLMLHTQQDAATIETIQSLLYPEETAGVPG